MAPNHELQNWKLKIFIKTLCCDTMTEADFIWDTSGRKKAYNTISEASVDLSFDKLCKLV